MTGAQAGTAGNAVEALVRLLGPASARRRAAREGLRGAGGALVEKYALDLVAFLNGATGDELRLMCAAAGLGGGMPGAMRQRLWMWGAALERRGVGAVDALVQPAPVVRGGRLRLPRRRAAAEARAAALGALPSARAARWPAARGWPRPVPPERPAATPAPAAEPETLDELLARADALVGVRLGQRGRDKGWYGQRVAELLGLGRSSEAAPDWRGEVEVKTLAVVRGVAGRWRLKDGPAIAMRSVSAADKLRRVLWVVRVDEGDAPGAPVLSWYYQELDPDLQRALERARHLRPKGGAGTSGRGWYLRRDFFHACGLLRSLNGD